MKLFNRWVYDLQGVLERHLDTLKDDLSSDDDRVRQQASNAASEILDWLHLPVPALSPDEQVQRALSALSDPMLSANQKLRAAQRAARSTGRPRGRPRTETAQHAIQALTLHFATPLSWREIALSVKGCNHKRPNPERSCEPCGEAIRNAATRLQSFLRSIGHDLSAIPRAARLDPETCSQLARMWLVEEKMQPSPRR